MARFETGNFTSQVYLTDHNLFGMKVAGGRVQRGRVGLKAPDGGFYWHYPSDSESVRDILAYFNQVNFPLTVSGPEQFASELKSRRYYGGSMAEYANGVKSYLNG